jgi:hypothetical protein
MATFTWAGIPLALRVEARGADAGAGGEGAEAAARACNAAAPVGI